MPNLGPKSSVAFQHVLSLHVARHHRELNSHSLMLHLQIVLVGMAALQIKNGASPWDRSRLLPIFFLGSAEVASGLTGL